MIKKLSTDIYNILYNKNEHLANEYARNIHEIVEAIVDSIVKLDKIVSNVNNKKKITENENLQLKKLCRIIIDEYYRFTERIKKFSRTTLSEISEEKYSPSFNRLNNKLLKARGASVHVKEPIYSFRQENNYFDCTCNTSLNPYSGKCNDVKVSFLEENGKISYSKEIQDYEREMKKSIIYTLSKFKEHVEGLKFK